MRKEVSIAIVIGILLGAIILYGLKLASDTTNSLNQTLPNTINQPTPTTTDSQDTKTSPLIGSHTTGQVLFEKDITLQGKTDPNTSVVIIWENDESIIQTETDGTFSQKISLIAGENIIKIDSLKTDKTLISEILKLYYSTKPIE